MIRLYLALLVTWLSADIAHAQDIVYLNDQTNVVGKLADLTAEKVTLLIPKGSSSVKFSYGADRVAVVVNQYGRFLCYEQLNALPANERDEKIRDFLNNTTLPKQDIIVRAIPAEVIFGKVSYAQGDAVNYTTLNGAAASLAKSDLVGIIYANGKHELYSDAMFLCENQEAINKGPASVDKQAPAPLLPKTTAYVDKPTATEKPGMLTMSEEEYTESRKQALERVQDFAILLGVVADKTVDASQRNNAIKQVLELFKPDATIQVSSMVRGGQTNTYKLKDYLVRLKLLPYKSVTLEWSDIQFVQELTQKDDGNYYGKIKGEQRFSGLNTNGDIQYGDITRKDVDVMVTPYKKKIESEDNKRWYVILGNVGVVATQ